jgi:histidine triad (HIT) family protein
MIINRLNVKLNNFDKNQIFALHQQIKTTMPSVFSKIISGEISSYKVYEDEAVFAFLDIFPKQIGHVLVVPKIEIDDFFELTESQIASIMHAAKLLSKSLKKVTGAKKIGLIVEGLQINHAHLHLIPISSDGDLHCTTKSFTAVQMQEIQAKIISNL